MTLSCQQKLQARSDAGMNSGTVPACRESGLAGRLV